MVEQENPLQEQQQLDQQTNTQQSISNLVNQQLSSQLQELGYSKNVSEKSLLLTNNVSIEAAVQWITDHQEDADLEEELLLVGQQDNAPKLSKEEAALRAKELQRKLREERAIREKKEAEEREKQRIISGKQLLEAKRLMEEAEQKRIIELKMKQKREDELAKQRMLEQLERDKQERFGKKYAPGSQSAQQQKTPLELAKIAIQQIKTAYPTNIFLDKAKNRVGELFGGLAVLKNAGFQEQDSFLVLNEPNIKLLQEIEACLTNEISQS